MTTCKIIKGKFYVVGYKPDGDSIRFQAINPAHWDYFQWSSPSAKASKRKQLRLEAIDALETHYNGFHQPRPFALAALEKILALVNIKDVKYSLSVATIVAARDGQQGYIASAGLDMYGRPVAFLFPKDTILTDGAELPLEQLPLEQSVNYRMVQAGLVYPTFYETTHPLVVQQLRTRTKANRLAEKGLWAIDRTPEFTLWDVHTIQDDVMILPKLFRRLASFFDEYGDFGQLRRYLNSKTDKLQWVQADGSVIDSSLASLLEVEGRRIRLNAQPEDLVFAVNPQ